MIQEEIDRDFIRNESKNKISYKKINNISFNVLLEFKNEIKNALNLSDFLYECARNDDSVFLKKLIKLCGDVNYRDSTRETPLHYACMFNSVNSVKLLIKNGADVNNKSRLGLTPLYEARYYKSLECTKLLIDHGADINIENNFGKTPLYSAFNFKSIECFKLLKKHGAHE